MPEIRIKFRASTFEQYEPSSINVETDMEGVDFLRALSLFMDLFITAAVSQMSNGKLGKNLLGVKKVEFYSPDGE